jgi:hypothetical protein
LLVDVARAWRKAAGRPAAIWEKQGEASPAVCIAREIYGIAEGLRRGCDVSFKRQIEIAKRSWPDEF